MSTTIEKSPPPAGGRRDDASPLVPTLLAVAKSVRALAGLALRDAGLVAGQDDFVLALGESGALTVRSAADALGVRPSTISKMADIMERKGLVVRSVDAVDGRRVLLRLTEAGVRMRSRVVEVHAALEADLVRDLRGDADGAATALSRLDHVLASRLSRLR